MKQPDLNIPPVTPSRTGGPLGRTLTEYVGHVRLFTRNARLYLLGAFLIAINFQVFNVLMNLYFSDLGFPEGQIGQINSMRATGMTLMAIPAAFIISRIALKPVLMVSTLLLGLFSFAMVTTTVWLTIISSSLLAGMAFTYYRVAGGPFFMRNSTKKERTHLFSFSFAMMTLAGITASFGSGWMAELLHDQTSSSILGYRYTLYIGIAVSMLALIPFGLIRPQSPSAEEHRLTLNWAKIRRRAGFYSKITVANLLIGMGAGLSIPFLNLYFKERFGLPPGLIGLFFSAVHFSMFFGTLSGPVWTRRIGLVRTVVISQLISIPFMLILSYGYLLPLVVVAFVLRGGLMNLGVPLTNNLAMELSDRSEQELVNAFMMISWTASWMIATAVGGRLIQAYGYTVTINTTIALYVISSIVFFWLFRGVEKQKSDGGGWYIPEDAAV